MTNSGSRGNLFKPNATNPLKSDMLMKILLLLKYKNAGILIQDQCNQTVFTVFFK